MWLVVSSHIIHRLHLFAKGNPFSLVGVQLKSSPMQLPTQKIIFFFFFSKKGGSLRSTHLQTFFVGTTIELVVVKEMQ